jgi:hypothetical protein
VLALSITGRESILRVLEDGPAEYAELRATLLKEHEWRVREGLALVPPLLMRSDSAEVSADGLVELRGKLARDQRDRSA